MRAWLGLLVQLWAGLALLAIMPVLDVLGLTSRWNNCFWAAMDQQRREGGIVVMRQSQYGWWLHFAHTADYQTSTSWNAERKHRRACPPLVFGGHFETQWLAWDNHHRGDG